MKINFLTNNKDSRKGIGTVDAIYNLKQVHNITNAMKKPVFLLFIDLTAAFDYVESLYSLTTTALAQTPEDKFDVKCGVRQGGPESPMLYNLIMDYVMRLYIAECKKEGIKFLNLKYSIPDTASLSNTETREFHILDWIGYADDLTLMFNDSQSLCKELELLDKTFKRFGLAINVSKTKTMIINYNRTTSTYPETITSLNGENIEIYIRISLSWLHNKI